jgi:translocation and assembly module TamB
MSASARPIRAALRLLLPLAMVLLLLALVLGALGGSAFWLLRSENGTRWLLARLPSVLQASGVRGALLSEHVEADEVRVFWAAGKGSVTIKDFKGDGLSWTWQPDASAWLGLRAKSLSAREVTVISGPHTGKPMTLPNSLHLPVRVAADALQVDELRVDEIAAFSQVRSGHVEIGADRHSVEQLLFEWQRLRIAGQANIAAARPFPLELQASVSPRDGGDAFAAALRAGGALERIAVTGTLRGTALKEHVAPQADVQATLLPFARWPLGELSASTQALDLSTLLISAPQTQLSGRVQVQSSAIDAPISASVQFVNAIPGRWNERRLPLRRVQLDLQGHAQERGRIELREIDLQLGSSAQNAGRWRGRGSWVDHQLRLETTLAAVLPQFIDGRAAAMTLSGPLDFTLNGLPSPDPAASSIPPPLALDLNAALDGRLAAAPQPVKLTLELSGDEKSLELRQLHAQSGTALLQLSASARRKAGGGLQLATAGSVNDFDPLPWWPGEPGSAWRQGRHRLTAGWQLDVALSPTALKLAPLAMLQSLAGSGTLHVHDSQLAGVPLAIDLTLGQTPSKEGTPNSLVGELSVGGNRISVEGRANPAGDGSADRLRFDLEAPALAGIAPLMRLWPQTAAWAPRAGSGQIRLAAEGRWPELRTQGQAQLKQLEAGSLGVGNGSLQWKLELRASGEEPLELVAELDNAHLGRQRAEQLRAELNGTLSDHRLRAYAALPLSPPALAEQLLGVKALSGTRAQLQAEGAWRADGSGGGRWRGHVTRLTAGGWDGITHARPDSEVQNPWIEATDLSAELQFGAEHDLTRVQAAAGRVKVANSVALRWDEVVVETQGGTPNIALRAELEPFAVAPLLARMQPGVGWTGDLRLAGKVDIHAAERFDAAIVFERSDGDLQTSDERGTQSLGLSSLRFELAAHDGNWVFSQALAGRTLGEMTGAMSVKSTPQRRWPAPDSPLEGVLQARVANLGIWATWVPPGWRLAGELTTNATIGGSFGAPEYTGSLQGRDIGVRNVLLGVNVSDGQLALRLDGASAQIERFTLKGGDGTLTLTGGATFGSAPRVQLHAQAERFRVLGRIDRQLTASGQADFSWQADQFKLDGKLGVDEGLFDARRGSAPGLDDDVTVHRAGDPETTAEASAAPRTRREVTVNVELDLGQKLRVRAFGVDTALRGKLGISTPNGRMAINGEVSTEGGTYTGYGQKLDIERGIVAFSGAYDTPRLDILALRPNIDTRVGVLITGNLPNIRVRLYSDPDLSDTDKLSWLVLGRAPDGLGRTDTALLQRAAVALLSGEGEAPTDAFMKSIGIDELSLRQSDTDVRETVINIGKQLSRRWYVGYERGVNATTGTFQLIYRIAQRFTLRAQSGQENSLDVIWTWKFDDLPKVPAPARAVPP